MSSIKARVGGVIELEVVRANGDVEYIGKIHNIIGSVAWQSIAGVGPGRIPYNSSVDPESGILSFYTRVDKGSTYLQGTLSQSGTTVTRASGLENLSDISNGDMIEFETGQYAYKTASISASSCTVSKSQTVAATTAKRHKTNTGGWGLTPSTAAIQSISLGAYSTIGAYSDGVVTNTLQSPLAFPIAVSSYTLACISVMVKIGSSYSQYGTYYDLPSPIAIAIGDRMHISSHAFTVTYDNYTPRVFGSLPITGASGPGKIQRLSPAMSSEYNDFSRFYLVADANKLTLPNMAITPLSISAIPARLEVITTSANTKVVANYSNNNIESVSATGTVVTGGVTKQIFWGDTNFLFGAIEYDTPVNIVPGKIININAAMQMIVERPAYGVSPFVPLLEQWQTDATDYFLTSAWGTTTGDNSTGSVNSWNGLKSVMSTTRGVTDLVRAGSGSGRRCLTPNGNLQMTGHPSGLVGVVFVFRRTTTNFCRLINYAYYTQGWYILSPGTNIALDGMSAGSAGSSVALEAETGAPYAWHAVAIKYNTTDAYMPKLWVDGNELVTGKSLSTAFHPRMVRWGDGGSFTDWELGDFAVYSNPSDANMAIYSNQLATKWQAP